MTLTVKQKIVCRILLLIAQMLCDDPCAKEIGNIATHIELNG